MSETQQAEKRIVSKGEYAAVQTSRTVLRVSAAVSLVEVFACLFLAFRSPYLHFGGFGVILALAFAIMAFRLGRGGLRKLRQAARMEKVEPLTQANVSLLPLAQTLGRASSPSPQEQRNVLLRAPLHDPQTPVDQLLRSANSLPDTASRPLADSPVSASASSPWIPAAVETQAKQEQTQSLSGNAPL